MKKIFAFILPLLFAVAFLFLPARHCSAYTLPDEDMRNIRNFLTTVKSSETYEGYNIRHCNAYVVYQATNIYGGCVVGLFPEPEYVKLFGETPVFCVNKDKDNDDCRGIFWTYIDGTFELANVANIKGNSNLTSWGFINGSWDDMAACNFALKLSDGTTVFPRAPLKGRILAAAEEQAVLGMVPLAVKIAKIAVIIAIGTLLLLKLLVPLVKKSLRLLVR